MRIALIGCGFLGSLWAEEMFKRLFALERDDVSFLFVDFDNWERRNAANQLCTPLAVGQSKAEFLVSRAEMYGLHAWRKLHRVGPENDDKTDELVEECDLWVDAVDNYGTRAYLWQVRPHRIPLLHLSISAGGTGDIEWSYTDYETWHLSPIRARTDLSKLDETNPTLPPCHLVAMRGLGLNVALAGAKAATLFLKEDIEELFGEGPQLAYPLLTTWRADNQSHVALVKEGDVYVIAAETPQAETQAQQGQEW